MAEKKLTAQQVRFVEFYCRGKSAMEAYRLAGYTGDPHKQAWQIKANQGVQEAIDEKLNAFVKNVDDMIKQSAEDAFNNEIHLMATAESEMVRLRASQDVLDRAGLKATDKFDGKIRHEGGIPYIDASGKQIDNDESPIKNDDKIEP